MKPEHIARARQLFLAALEQPRDERHAFLADATRAQADGEQILAFVEQLLSRDGCQTEDLVRPVLEAPAVPTKIGAYTIGRELGQGGMGAVYLAQQSDPVQRQVALKLIRLGTDSKQIVARFERERQALARMSHENIAKVFDAGVTDEGLPYFVMEYINGEPIHAYCDQRRLTVPERLELFEQVCSGVQHAHLKGVLHRDLKPTNVLVADIDGPPQVKIIDFGLARATQPEATGETVHTKQGLILGTPEYMSPEQAGADQVIDTRTDVYALGAMLYELLTGELPLDSELLRSGGLEVMRELILEREPLRPSLRIEQAANAAMSLARARRTTPRELSRALRGDLDWIVLQALEKEPERRYASALELASDLRRFREHEPVLAGPPSASYRLRKLLRRHRIAAIAALLIVLTLLVGTLGTGAGLIRAADRQERFDHLAMLLRLDDAEGRIAKMFPPSPEVGKQLEDWLTNDAAPIVAGLPAIRSSIIHLRAQASRATEAEVEAIRREHEEFPRLESERRRLQALAERRARRTGDNNVATPELTEEQQGWSVQRLVQEAFDRLGPRKKHFGEVPLGVALAQESQRRAVGTSTSPDAAIALAWAYFELGQDDAAHREMQRAIELDREYPPKMGESPLRAFGQTPEGHAEIMRREREVEDYRDLWARREIARLEDACLDWEFERAADEFLHDTLVRLHHRISEFRDGWVRQAKDRAAWCRSIDALTRDHPRAHVSWAEARAAIAKADGIVASKLYQGFPIDLAPQRGLVPIGMNPKTKLWEFYHLRSAWHPVSGVKPSELSIPRIADYDAAGKLPVEATTGIVFVLLPGGTFWFGAQSTDIDGPNFETAPQLHMGVQQLTLAPFFLAKHELTQSQFAALAREEAPNEYTTGRRLPGMRDAITRTHPAENMTWRQANDLMERFGLLLPTEAQWEYGCRAGTSTPWFMGRSANSMEGYVNTLDSETRKATQWPGECAPWSDGYITHAPVGTFGLNPFGLGEMAGNVSEWCRDPHGDRSWPTAPGDAFRLIPAEESRVARGGSYITPFGRTRSSSFMIYQSLDRVGLDVGIRPSRLLYVR